MLGRAESARGLSGGAPASGPVESRGRLGAHLDTLVFNVQQVAQQLRLEVDRVRAAGPRGHAVRLQADGLPVDGLRVERADLLERLSLELGVGLSIHGIIPPPPPCVEEGHRRRRRQPELGGVNVRDQAAAWWREGWRGVWGGCWNPPTNTVLGGCRGLGVRGTGGAVAYQGAGRERA
jgi:hypothetical protein